MRANRPQEEVVIRRCLRWVIRRCVGRRRRWLLGGAEEVVIRRWLQTCSYDPRKHMEVLSLLALLSTYRPAAMTLASNVLPVPATQRHASSVSICTFVY